MLGKRPRSSSPSNASGILEKGQVDVLSDEEAARAVLRPDKKRAKLDGRASSSSPNKPTTLEVAAQLLAPRIPSFTIFQGPESDFSTPYPRGDPPPPTNLLPEVYRPPSPSGAPLLPPARAGSGSRTTSSAASSENQRRHFDFSLFPAVNEHETFIPPIPFPEAPQSPTPASSNLGHQHHIQDDGRTDPFKEYGFPSPRRPRIASGSRASGTQREVSSNDIAAGLGLTMVRTGHP
ncbi:hypothetical protein DFP72DRAFT_14238 [Ephemerocybe angulata]|uniref:Uncharacterized protein n=1 Tax=Ephemerocybe angulata TaxID=980116 RepID=A0A8H6MHE5_9AGAR|nr:hypothetical protein DFP72DRAFT_14238 [Tulosesus angulatus]